MRKPEHQTAFLVLQSSACSWKQQRRINLSSRGSVSASFDGINRLELQTPMPQRLAENADATLSG